MTGKDTEKSSETNNEPGAQAKDGKPGTQEEQGKGIKSRLTDAQKEMLASKSRGGAGSQSVGHSHKPTHVSGKQGPAEKKVRW
ncbi:hypothetical protein [Arthrobacter sp. CG_A4]|uniref:hypothetical protein n=1 Tax=Arthrobacter sp. CG_A4 TaxID=3071706 RepID=UPI002E0B5811|nr:hypothetical protein [Arthrobacter sp. CG_A4]